MYPLSKKVAGGEQESTAATTTLNAARRDFQRAQATVKGKGQADQELQKFYSEVLPPDMSARAPHHVPAEFSSSRSSAASGSSARTRSQAASATASW